jgi:hypothetical protein
MVRTHIRFDEDEYARAQAEAKTLGISVAEFVRRAVRNALQSTGNRPWMRFVGFVESGDPASSQSVDSVVYRRKH